MKRLLLADRIKTEADSFLAPLLPALRSAYDVRFVSLPPGPALAEAIGWADIVWLEWCWDHAVWATREAVVAGKPCFVRLHSIEALQTDYLAQVDWSRVAALVTVSDDIAQVLRSRSIQAPVAVIPNGIDMDRFRPGTSGRHRIAWVGHLEPKKNPMLMLQIAYRLRFFDPAYQVFVAGAVTDLRTIRYLRHMRTLLGLDDAVTFEGHIADMPAWYADKGVLLSTSMYESFGMNIGEAMATGAFPVVHAFPGAEALWPQESLFASADDAVVLIQSARLNAYRGWVADRYSLDRQAARILALLADRTR